MSHIKLEVSKSEQASAKNPLAVSKETYVIEAGEGEGLALDFLNEIILFSISIAGDKVRIIQDEDSIDKKLFFKHKQQSGEFKEITVVKDDKFSLSLSEKGLNSTWDIKFLEIS